MKYIVFERPLGDDGMTQKIPIIFPNNLTHSLVAEAMLTSEELKDAKPVSAGDLSSLGFEDVCSGESQTLKLKSHPDDTMLIRMMDYRHGL